MKKVINWTFGSIFRTFGKFIAFTIIGGGIFYLINYSGFKMPSILNLLGIGRVYAASSSYTSANYRVFYCITQNCSQSGQTSYTNVDTATSFNDEYWLNRLVVGVKYNNGYLAGNTYTFRWRVNLNNPYIPLASQNNVSVLYNFDDPIIYSGSTTTDTTTNEFIDDYSIWFENDTSQANRFYMYFRFSPTSTVKSFRVFLPIIEPNGYNYANWYEGYKWSSDYVNFFGLTVSYSEGVGSIIENQTTIIQNNFNETNNAINNVNDSVNDLNDSINDDDTSEATSEASDFFSNFSTNNHGLTGIITAPLNAIQSLTSSTCSSLVLPIPFLNNQNLTLPCMRQIYVDNFGSFMTIYDTIILGIVSYWIMVRIFSMVKDFKNPAHDEIEVVDL